MSRVDEIEKLKGHLKMLGAWSLIVANGFQHFGHNNEQVVHYVMDGNILESVENEI